MQKMKNRTDDNDNNRFPDDTKNDKYLKIGALKPRSWTGYVFALLSALLAAVGGIFFKLCNEEAAKTVLLRCLFQYLVLLPVITVKNQVIFSSELQTNLLLLLRGLCGPLGMTTFAQSMRYLPLGDATTVCYTYPALVFLFACICLKEKCGILNIVLTIITAVGLVFITQPIFIFHNATVHQTTNLPSDQLIGVGLGLATAALTALVTVILRKLGPGIPFTISLFYYAWEGLVIIFAYLAIGGKLELPCLKELPLMVAAGAATFLTQIFTTLALQRERAGPVTLIKTTEVMFSFLFQYFVFGVAPSVLSGIGAALILSCSIVIGIKHTYKWNVERE